MHNAWRTLLLAVLVLLVTVSVGHTGSLTMTFEGLTSWEIVNEYYNGGYGIDYFNRNNTKSGPGPDYGITFVGAYAAIDADEGGDGNFGNEPSPSTAIWCQQSGAWMNVSGGFTGLSFYYTNPNSSMKVYVYSGMNKTGSLLAMITLPKTEYCGAPDPTGNLSPFHQVSVSFDGIAKSFDFSEAANSAYFDNITIETPIPIADAGGARTVYAWIDGIARVAMDGSRSTCGEGQSLSYYWSWTVNGSTYQAEGVNPILQLPAGEYTIQLIVNDGKSFSEPAYAKVTVIAPLPEETIGFVLPLIGRNGPLQQVLAIMHMPTGISRTDIQQFSLYPAGGTQGITGNILTFQKNGYAILAFSKTGLMSLVPSDGFKTLYIVGQLKSGQYFFGKSFILILR